MQTNKPVNDLDIDFIRNHALHNSWYDCTEIVDDLNSIYGTGTIWKIQNKNELLPFHLIEYGKVKDYYNHYVYEMNGQCIDIRYSGEWVSLDDYKKMLTELNENDGNELVYTREG